MYPTLSRWHCYMIFINSFLKNLFSFCLHWCPSVSCYSRLSTLIKVSSRSSNQCHQRGEEENVTRGGTWQEDTGGKKEKSFQFFQQLREKLWTAGRVGKTLDRKGLGHHLTRFIFSFLRPVAWLGCPDGERRARSSRGRRVGLPRGCLLWLFRGAYRSFIVTFSFMW
jgi:hypothetical protein